MLKNNERKNLLNVILNSTVGPWSKFQTLTHKCSASTPSTRGWGLEEARHRTDRDWSPSHACQAVETLLTKIKEEREATEKYESAQHEIEKCHEQIQRGANVQSAQARQIEEMAAQLVCEANKKEVGDRSKLLQQ